MNTFVVESEATSLESLVRIDRRISMESEHLAQFATTLRGVIPTLVDTTTSFLSRFTSKSATEVKAPTELPYSDYMAFLRLMEEHKYMELSELSFYVPEGFKGSLLEYAKELKQSLDHANNLIANVLNPYAMFLSKIVTNKDASMRTTKDLDFLNKSDKERGHLIANISNFFERSSTASKTTLGKVIARNNDWKPLLNAMAEVRTASQILKPETVQNSVKDMVALLENLKSAVANGDLDRSSGETLKTLSQATLSAAKEVEFYSITIYRAFTLGNLLNDNMTDIKTEISKKK